MVGEGDTDQASLPVVRSSLKVIRIYFTKGYYIYLLLVPHFQNRMPHLSLGGDFPLRCVNRYYYY